MEKTLKILVSCVIFNCIFYVQAGERKLYVGHNSTEAILEFNAVIQYTFSRKPQEKTIRKAIELQLDHMVGPMSEAAFSAVPKGDHEITDIKIVEKFNNTFSITYHYRGTIVVALGPTKFYDLVLPINPANIYKDSMIGNSYPCTDDHYQSEGDFWYFWNPNRPGCKLVKDKDYFVIKGVIKRFINTKLSYPEYHNLPDKKGNITIHVIFGMDDVNNDRNPLTSQDINSSNYRYFRSYLIKKGYAVTTWNENQIRSIAKSQNESTLPVVETLQRGKIIYRFFFGPTGIDENSLAFHWFYKDAIENASVLIYGGHSGLGGHLDLDLIENNLGVKIRFNTNRYQIFFFDSCTSYRYYNDLYFDRKKSPNDPTGSKKLDIFTNGLATYFDTMGKTNSALARAVESAIQYAISGTGLVSYQTLAKQIDSDNLFGISGDQDNEAPKPIK